MDKQLHNRNGFTLIEALFVLMIVSILSLSFIGHSFHPSMELFIQKMMMKCVITQEQAFIEKKDMKVSIQTTYAKFNETIWYYPKSVSCIPFDFHYNAKGNISKAKTIECSDGIQSRKLIFQLGSGRVRSE